jgi:hypothetical protein
VTGEATEFSLSRLIGTVIQQSRRENATLAYAADIRIQNRCRPSIHRDRALIGPANRW